MLDKAAWRKRQQQWARFHEWEEQQLRASRQTPQEAFRAFDELYQLARTLGVFGKLRDPTACEAALRVAALANHRPSSR